MKTQALLRYLIIINVITLIARYSDKYKAIKGNWRIPEKQLLMLSALGGRVGGLVGMSWFRHKSIKGSFLWKFVAICMIWIIIISIFLFEKVG